jgi:acetoin utilization protein AcuB
MLVRHFMTSQVLSLNESQSCRSALRFLREHSIRRAPVVRDGALVGMVSERDLLRVLPGTIPQLETEAGADAERLPVSRVMASKVVSLHPEEHLEDAARKMLSNKLGGLPVLDGNKLVGILTESDIFRVLTRVLDSRGVLRISVARTARGDLPADPVRMAMKLGFEVRGLVTHDRPGGETLIVLRVVGERGDELVEAFGAAGYNVLEIVDARSGDAPRPAA